MNSCLIFYWNNNIIKCARCKCFYFQAWLEAYHNVQLGSGILNYGNIDARAGSIQAAVNLEIHSPKISHIDLKIEGLNGQLPNLDLVNLVHKLCKNEGIRHTFKNKVFFVCLY